MGDREVKKDGGSIQGESQIGTFSTLHLSLRNGLQASIAEEDNEKLE